MGEEEEDQNMNMLVCRVLLLKNRKETVSVGEEEEDQNMNMLVLQSVAAEEQVGYGVSG